LTSGAAESARQHSPQRFQRFQIVAASGEEGAAGGDAMGESWPTSLSLSSMSVVANESSESSSAAAASIFASVEG
jgi:hypothetical protein